MGMFDWVKYDEGKCPKCGEALSGWQSKDGPCVLAELEPWQVDNFYTSCDNCGQWVNAKVDAEIEHVVKRCEVTLHIPKERD